MAGENLAVDGKLTIATKKVPASMAKALVERIAVVRDSCLLLKG